MYAPPQPALNPMQMPLQSMHQMMPLQDQWANIWGDLNMVAQQLDAEKPSVGILRDSEPQAGNYWQRLFNCSMNLQKVVSDICVQNPSPAPIPSQYSYAQALYLPPSMAEPQRQPYPPQYYDMAPYSSHP